MIFETLQYILAIAEAGSISKAAANLYLAQPNLSKIVSDLEDELGFRIFHRTSKGVTLTSRGQDFVSAFEKNSTCTVALNVNSIPHNKTVGNFIFLFL